MSRIDRDDEPLRFTPNKRKEAHKIRKTDEKAFTIVSVILYSVFLVFVVIAAYVGVKLFITSKKNEKIEEVATQVEEVQEIVEEEPEEEEIEEEPEEEEIEEEEPEGDNVWHDTVFSRLENVKNSDKALINSYDFTRMHSKNDSGHEMDYEVYSDKNTGKIEKITTTENCGDLFEIIDYYYDDGKINYIAQYSETINIPINVSTADVTSRYYFNRDTLVRYIYCENDKAIEYNIKDLSKYSAGTRGQYEYLENMMLERAEFTWDEIKKLQKTVVVEGYVLDEFNQVLTENTVTLIDERGNVADSTETNGDGFYSFTINANDSKEYTIRTVRDTLVETNVYGIKPTVGSKKVCVPTIYMAYERNSMPFQTQIFAKDADTSENLVDAGIKFRYGLNCKEGDSFLAGNLGEYGYISPQLRSGCYTAEITKDGYETLYMNFVVKSDHLAAVAFAVKNIAEGEIKAVLSWEANPLDLNIRCITSNASNKFISPKDSLGSTDAEIIDIFNAGEESYYFYVSDYTNIAIDNYVAYSMSECIANIALYNEEGLIMNISVPAAHAGVVWKPFEIRNRKVIITEDYYSSLGDNSVFKKK